MEITLLSSHVTPSHGELPQGSSDCPQVGGAFCHWSINARSTEAANKPLLLYYQGKIITLD
jgi:hypothetical protein